MVRLAVVSQMFIAHDEICISICTVYSQLSQTFWSVRSTIGTGKHHPLVACCLYAKGDGQFATAHVARGEGDECSVESPVSSQSFDDILGLAVTFLGDDYDLQVGRIILCQP